MRRLIVWIARVITIAVLVAAALSPVPSALTQTPTPAAPAAFDPSR